VSWDVWIFRAPEGWRWSRIFRRDTCFHRSTGARSTQQQRRRSSEFLLAYCERRKDWDRHELVALVDVM